MELTAEQRAAAEESAPRTIVVGAPATGKTTTLLARYRRLTGRLPASRVLVLCRDRAAAQRFTDAALAGVTGGFDVLPVTTVYGLAFSLLGDSGIRLVTAAEQRVRVTKLLAAERPADWPELGHLLARPAFVGEVVAALAHLHAAGYEAAEGADGAWPELARFARRYVESLERTGEVDSSLLLARAVTRGGMEQGRFDHVVIDDADSLPVLGGRLAGALVADGTEWTVGCQVPDAVPLSAPAVTVRLGTRFRAAPPGCLIRCGHPSIEPEAIAGELLAAHAEGVPWSAMAVVVRRLGRSARATGRSLARHGIPVVPVAELAPDEPVVRAVLDLLRWVNGDEEVIDRLVVSPLAGLDSSAVRAARREAATTGRTLVDDARLAHLRTLGDHLAARLEAGDSPADLAYEAWAKAFADLAAPGRRTSLGAVDDRALDALVALVDGLRHFGERNTSASLGDALAAVDEGGLVPDPWRVTASTGTEGVTITSIEVSAGREWHTVVVAGCVEGELPRPQRRVPLLDPDLLLAAAAPSPEDRRRRALAEERRLFAVATSRARSRLVATAAPQPGVLLSRFVESWPPAPLRLPLAPGQPPPARAVTASPVPAAPEGRLQLSATQLDTYDDCPLRYAYQYVLRARDDPGVHASLGSLVHKVLATFLDPDGQVPRTFDGLMAVASEAWQEDVARYRPQVEEARRDFVSMLEAWWEHEGDNEGFGPEVLAVERRFRFDVGPHSLTGAIDRVDRVDDGEGIRVVDYKTGKREPAPADVADDLQLAVYHLAASRDPELAALGRPTQLQLRYLRSMRTYEQPVTDGHAAATERRVLAMADRILAEDFSPSVHANCRTCSFQRLCPLWPEGRQVGAP